MIGSANWTVNRRCPSMAETLIGKSLPWPSSHLVGPDWKRGGIRQAAGPPADTDPRFLEHIPGGTLVAGQPPGVPLQSALPSADQYLERLGIALLTPQHQQFVAEAIMLVHQIC
jgi:hypothetical protein